MKFLLVAVYDSDLNECILGFYLKERTKWIYEGQTYPEAKVMQIQQNELMFSIDDIVQGIDSNITKELVRYIYMGNDVTLFENRDSYSSEGVIVTSDEDEVIEFGDGSTLKFQDVFELFEATDEVEVVQLSSGNDIIDAKGNMMENKIKTQSTFQHKGLVA